MTFCVWTAVTAAVLLAYWKLQPAQDAQSILGWGSLGHVAKQGACWSPLFRPRTYYHITTAGRRKWCFTYSASAKRSPKKPVLAALPLEAQLPDPLQSPELRMHRSNTAACFRLEGTKTTLIGPEHTYFHKFRFFFWNFLRQIIILISVFKAVSIVYLPAFWNIRSFGINSVSIQFLCRGIPTRNNGSDKSLPSFVNYQASCWNLTLSQQGSWGQLSVLSLSSRSSSRSCLRSLCPKLPYHLQLVLNSS